MTAAGPAATGCTTHQCDQSTYVWPSAPALLDGGHAAGHGFMVDENTYETNGLNDPWLDFRGNTTIQIQFPPEVAGRTPLLPVVAIGTDQDPNSPAAEDAGANYTQSVGQLAIFNDLNTNPVANDAGTVLYAGGFALTNVSCASYFAHVQVQFLPRDAATETSGALDGGAEADAEPDGSD
jgi:hypothetical protein